MHPFETSIDGRRLTIVDVARLLHVHPSTVSRALRNSPTLPASTIERIQAAAKELGYRVDPLTAALMRSRRLGKPVGFRANIGILVCEPKSEACRPTSRMYEVYSGAKTAAGRVGYGLELFWLSDLHANARSFERMLRARGILGLILPPEHEASLPFDLPWDTLSFVSLQHGDSRATPRFHQVVSNHFDSMLQISAECRALGYRRVGLILRDHSDRLYEYGRVVHGAFLAGFAHRTVDEVAVEPLVVNKLRVDEIAKWLLRERPDAIIMAGGGFSSSFHPRDLVAGLSSNGIAIGRQVGLVIMCHKPHAQFAVVDERADVIGEVAVDSLVDLIKTGSRGVPTEPLVMQVDGRFHHGPSLPSRVCFDLSTSSCRPENRPTPSH